MQATRPDTLSESCAGIHKNSLSLIQSLLFKVYTLYFSFKLKHDFEFNLYLSWLLQGKIRVSK